MAATLKVMTFNLRRDVEQDGTNAWRHRRDALAALVRREAPDVLGTQEGLAHQLDDLDERLPGYARVGGDRHGDGSDERCAVFYRADRFDLVAWGDLWLSDTPGTPGSSTWGNRHPRIVTWAQLRDRETGREHAFANTHLDHESETARREAARLLARRLPNAVLMGDFNAAPGDEPHAILLDAGWVDAHASHTGRCCATFHGFTGKAWERLDWVLAPRSHAVRAHRVVVEDGTMTSDHHPVVVELEPSA